MSVSRHPVVSTMSQCSSCRIDMVICFQVLITGAGDDARPSDVSWGASSGMPSLVLWLDLVQAILAVCMTKYTYLHLSTPIYRACVPGKGHLEDKWRKLSEIFPKLSRKTPRKNYGSGDHEIKKYILSNSNAETTFDSHTRICSPLLESVFLKYFGALPT